MSIQIPSTHHGTCRKTFIYLLSLIDRYESGQLKLQSDSFAAILAALRRHGIRFVDESEEFGLGLVLLRKRTLPEKP